MNSQRIDQLRKLRQEEPNDPFYTYALALEFLHSNKQEAIQLLTEVLDRHQDYLPAYYQAAVLQLEANKLSAVESILQRGIALAKEQKDSKALQELQNLLNNLSD